MILEKNLYGRKNRIKNLIVIIKRCFPFFLKLLLRNKKVGVTSTLGAPLLTVLDSGNLRCTSCLLCQKICPSHCIEIDSEGIEEESAPNAFNIEILRCTFCGLCEEVCPVDAIRMEGEMPKAGHSEQNWVWDMNYLKSYSGEKISLVGDDRPLLPD